MLKSHLKTFFRISPETKLSPRLGYVFSVLSSLFTAGVIILGKWVLSHGDAIFLAGLSIFFSGIMLAFWVGIKDSFVWIPHLSLKSWHYILSFTFFSIFALGSYWLGVSMVDATKVGFITRVQTIIIILISIAILKEKFSIVEFLAAMVVFTGAMLIKRTMSVEMSIGFWILVFSAIFSSIVELIAKFAVKYVAPDRLSFFRNMGVGLILVLWRTIAGEANFRLGMLWLGVIGMAILGPLGARVFYLYALKHADISKTTLLTHIQPVFVVILAIIILHQYPSGGELLGGVLIILGCCGIIFLRPRILNRFKQLLRNNL